MYVCKRREVIIIVAIVCYDQVRSGRGERPWMQALLSRRPWRLHASPHGRFSRAARSRRGLLSGLPPSLSGLGGVRVGLDQGSGDTNRRDCIC